MNFVSAEHRQYMRSSTAIDVLFVVDRGYRLRQIIDSKVQSPKWSQTSGPGFHDMSLQSFRLRLLKLALEYWREPFLQSVPAFIMSSNSW